MSGCFGHADAIGHAGELLQGALSIAGVAEPFLITLPAPMFRSKASVWESAEWEIRPKWKTKALTAARNAAAAAGFDGSLSISSESDILVGRGFGSSTADCVAVVRAVDAALRRQWSNNQIASLVCRAEIACDATMFDMQPLVFRHRTGVIHHTFSYPWPQLHVTIVDLGGPPVDTLRRRLPHYTNEELSEFAWLITEVEAALRTADIARLAYVASRSASIQQAYDPNPNWRDFCAAAHQAGALGVARAHSGTIAALLSPALLHWPGAVHYSLGSAVYEGEAHVHCAGRRR